MLFRRISFVLALALAADFTLAQNQQLLQKRQKEQREQNEQTTRGMTQLPGAYKLHDVFDIRVEKNFWVLTSSLPVQRSPARLRIEGLDGVSILRMSALGSNKAPADFNFTNTTFSDPNAVQVAASLTVSYGTLSLGRYSYLLDGYHNVTLTQGNILDDSVGRVGRSGVQFSVQIGDGQGTSTTSFQYVAPDFATLRRQHPKEIDQYLRPLLRQLQMESVLAADPMIAWQVFADDLKPDPAAVKQVEALLPVLDSDSFKERDSALWRLQHKGLPIAVAIRHLDRSKLSDQQNTLLDTVMAVYQPQRGTDLSKWRNDSDFLLDCLYTEDLAIRAAALDALQKKLEKLIQFDVTADFETRRSAVDALRN